MTFGSKFTLNIGMFKMNNRADYSFSNSYELNVSLIYSQISNKKILFMSRP